MSVEDRDRARSLASDANRLLARCAAAVDDARARLAATTADLFIPPRYRISDRRRAAMLGHAGHIVETVERALRAELAVLLAADAALAGELAGDSPSLTLPVLQESGVLRDDDFIASLLRRAESDSFAIEPWSPPAIEGDAALAEAWAAYRAARLPRAGRTGLSAELQHRMIWWIGAALRRHLVNARAIPAAIADQAVMSAAYAVLAGYDESERIEARALLLARALHGADRLDDALLADAAEAGEASLVAAGLAVRAGIGFEAAWDMAVDPEATRLVVLLRATATQRVPAARIALAFSGGDPAVVADAMDGYDALGLDQARGAVRPWRLDAQFRRAIDDIEDAP